MEGACETIPMALQGWANHHRNDDSWALLQVDLTNAFNSIDRGIMLEEVSRRSPELTTWANFCYAQHSHLFMDGHPISSQQGVQQGDPYGPLFFSLCWQRVVEKLPPDLKLNVWYLDDRHLVGSKSTLIKALSIIEAEGNALRVLGDSRSCSSF